MQPNEKRKVASSGQIIQWIREGNAVLTKKNDVNQSDIKTLTIQDIMAAYIGADDYETQQICYPFAKIEATANMGTNEVGIGLYCPILTTNIIR